MSTLQVLTQFTECLKAHDLFRRSIINADGVNG